MVSRWHYLPIGLVASGVAVVVIGALANHAALGWWQAPIYAGCVAALAAVLLFRRELGQVEVELEQLRLRLAAEEAHLTQQRQQLELLQQNVEAELKSQSSRLDKREQAMADRLVTYHEWMEFPQPLELARAAQPSDAELSALAKNDRDLQELLKAETKSLYDRILQNKYAPDGQVQLPIIRDDVLALIVRVARIYQPAIEQPLLEASLPRVLRGVSRACLHLLVVLDELPVNVQGASLNTLYGYIRNAVSAWRMYKSTEPYWPYVNTAYYLGRFALGANPITLGAWWFVGSLGTRGAQAIAQHVINRQALEVLSSLVRVIGYEVAGIYGGDFRHRDANWIYAAELTELVSQFPLSRDSLAHALREVGSLQLRSEYDRTFLYRCLASRKSADPDRYAATSVLTMEERRAAGTRLERFLEAFIHGKSADRIGRWKKSAEERLGLKLSVSLKASPASVRDQIVDAVRSLASFLVAIKQLEPADAVPLLAGRAVLGELPAEERAKLLDQLAGDAAYFFEHPDLDPDGDLVDKYLDDLAALHAAAAPRGASLEETLGDVAAYLRRPPKKMQALIEKHYAARLAQRLPADASMKKVPPEAARAALDLLVDPAEPGRFLLGPAKLEWPEGTTADALSGAELWLLGAGERLLLFAAGEQPQVVWRGTTRDVHAEAVRQLLAGSCRLTGGQWQTNGQSRPLAIRLPTGLMQSYAAQFRPLLAMLEK